LPGAPPNNPDRSQPRTQPSPLPAPQVQCGGRWPCSGVCSGVVTTSTPCAGRAGPAGDRAMRRPARMNGSRGSARSLVWPAATAATGSCCPSRMRRSTAIWPANTRLASTPCWRTTPVICWRWMTVARGAVEGDPGAGTWIICPGQKPLAQTQASRSPLSSRWRPGDQRSTGRQLQHRLEIGLAHPLELFRREPRIPGRQQRRELQLRGHRHTDDPHQGADLPPTQDEDESTKLVRNRWADDATGQHA